MKDNCIFCSIINKSIQCYSIFEDDIVLSFLDIQPGVLGHVLVIPKIHVKNIFELSDSKIFIHFFQKVQFLAKIIKDTLKTDGLNIIQNNGIAAGQTILHLHVHLFPRWIKDNALKLWTPFIQEEEVFKNLQSQFQKSILSNNNGK